MSVKLTMLWKENATAGATPRALSDIVASNVVQGVIHKSGRALAVAIERDELERLLAERPGGAQSALQAVKESFAEIGLMRERGVTWAEIADLLGQNGMVARDGKRFSAATVRAAFFLVGAEIRQGQLLGDADAGNRDLASLTETVIALEQSDSGSADAARHEPVQSDPDQEPFDQGAHDDTAESASSDAAGDDGFGELPPDAVEPAVESLAAEAVPDMVVPDFVRDDGVEHHDEADLVAVEEIEDEPPPSKHIQVSKPPVRRADDMLLMMPVSGAAPAPPPVSLMARPIAAPITSKPKDVAERWTDSRLSLVASPTPEPEPQIQMVPKAGPKTTGAAAHEISAMGKRVTPEAALKLDWTRRVDFPL